MRNFISIRKVLKCSDFLKIYQFPATVAQKQVGYMSQGGHVVDAIAALYFQGVYPRKIAHIRDLPAPDQTQLVHVAQSTDVRQNLTA